MRAAERQLVCSPQVRRPQLAPALGPLGSGVCAPQNSRKPQSIREGQALKLIWSNELANDFCVLGLGLAPPTSQRHSQPASGRRLLASGHCFEGRRDLNLATARWLRTWLAKIGADDGGGGREIATGR